MDNEEAAPEQPLQYWSREIDGAPFGCWYRLRDDGQVEILSFGSRVVLPPESIALLPEPLARAVLAKVIYRHEDGGGSGVLNGGREGTTSAPAQPQQLDPDLKISS